MPTPVGAGRWGSCLPVRRRASPARTVDISGRSARTKSGWFQVTHYKRKKFELLHKSFSLPRPARPQLFTQSSTGGNGGNGETNLRLLDMRVGERTCLVTRLR